MAQKDVGVIQPITAKRKAQNSGEALSNQDILDCITAAGFQLKYNEVTSELEINGEGITDAHYADIVGTLRVEGEKSEVESLTKERHIQLALDYGKARNKYDPLNDYLDEAYGKFVEKALQMPGDWSPIRELRKAIIARREDDAGDEGVDWPYECLVHWLCGAVAKIRHGSQSWMLVLQGKQGVGKSLLARKLGRAAGSQYFHAGMIDPRNKDHIIKRSTTFVWEAEELDGTMNGADMALLKAFLTQDTSKERMPYARYATTFKNRASFIGTVNTANFLKDTTGNRRFLVIEILDMDRERILMMDEDMIWGEACHMLGKEVDIRDGHIMLPEMVKMAQSRVNEEARAVSALEVALNARILAKEGSNVSSEQLRSLITALGFLPHNFAQAQQYMKDKGFEYKRCVRVNGKITTGFTGCMINNP